MTATNHTEHYDLSQYTEGDHPTYTGDYNGDMRKNVSRGWKDLPDSSFKIVGATLMDVSVDRTHIQCLFAYTDSRGVSVFVRQGWVGIENNPWKRLLDESDLSAMTSRIAALESQVAALTADTPPSTTGLTAKESDMQYSDRYNIVRVGTPARSTETE